jgi:cell division protein FtsQ
MNLRNRFVALSIILFAAAVYLLAWSPVFTVKSIDVLGAPSSVSTSSLINKSGVTVGEKLARIEPRSIEKFFDEISWVKSASVSRNWISGNVSIEMVPRVAVGIYKNKALDADGVIFDLPGATPHGLPVVSASSPALGLSAIDLFSGLPADIKDSMISLSASAESTITSWQQLGASKIKVTWGSASQINLKVSVYRALIALPENKAIRRMDLSAPHAPIVK